MNDFLLAYIFGCIVVLFVVLSIGSVDVAKQKHVRDERIDNFLNQYESTMTQDDTGVVTEDEGNFYIVVPK